MPSLNELLGLKQQSLEAKLHEATAFAHGPAKGDTSELNWEGMLTAFLPRRYRISRGAFLIDCEGNESGEMDLVIRDNYFHPSIFEIEVDGRGRAYIPIESVYGVFEVKQEINKEYLEQAQKKAEETRRLAENRTNTPIVHVDGVSEPRPPLRIDAGILADRSSWAEPFGSPFVEILRESSELEQVDLGLALGAGAFEAAYTNGEVELETCSQERGLIFFLTHLYTRLQKMGSVPGLDLVAYDREAAAEAEKG